MEALAAYGSSSSDDDEGEKERKEEDEEEEGEEGDDVDVVGAGRPVPGADSDDSYSSGGEEEAPAAPQDSAEQRQREAESRLKAWEEKHRDSAAGSGKASALPSALSALASAGGAASFLDPEANRPPAAAVVAAARVEQAKRSRSRSRSPPPQRPRDLASLAPELKEKAIFVEPTTTTAPTTNRNPSQIGPQPPAAPPARKSAATLAREKQKRVADSGVRASGAWKSEEEMVLRQQFDS